MSLSLFHRLPKQVLPVHRITKKRTGLGLDVEKEMATHSSILAWRIPGTEEPSGLPSMGLHRVGHDWSDLAAAAAGLDETLDHLWSLRRSSQQYFSTSHYCIECTLQIRDSNSSFCNVVSGSISLCHPQEKGFSVQFSYSVISDSLWPQRLQHARLPCPSPTPEACSNSCPLSQWCHPTISYSVVPFSSFLQSFPASGSFPVSQFFASGGQSIGVSAWASVLPIMHFWTNSLIHSINVDEALGTVPDTIKPQSKMVGKEGTKGYFPRWLPWWGG